MSGETHRTNLKIANAPGSARPLPGAHQPQIIAAAIYSPEHEIPPSKYAHTRGHHVEGRAEREASAPEHDTNARAQENRGRSTFTRTMFVSIHSLSSQTAMYRRQPTKAGAMISGVVPHTWNRHKDKSMRTIHQTQNGAPRRVHTHDDGCTRQGEG